MLIWLNVNIGGTPFDRIGQNQVDQFNNGRFLTRIRQISDIDIILILDNFEIDIL